MKSRVLNKLTTAIIKRLMPFVAILGIGMAPCPDCGTPMILHFWPLAGLLLLSQTLRKRQQKTTQTNYETESGKS